MILKRGRTTANTIHKNIGADHWKRTMAGARYLAFQTGTETTMRVQHKRDSGGTPSTRTEEERVRALEADNEAEG